MDCKKGCKRLYTLSLNREVVSEFLIAFRVLFVMYFKKEFKSTSEYLLFELTCVFVIYIVGLSQFTYFFSEGFSFDEFPDFIRLYYLRYSFYVQINKILIQPAYRRIGADAI